MSEIIQEVKGDITDVYSQIFEDLGINPTMIQVYMEVFFAEEPIGLQEIAKGTGYSMSTICKTMDFLERMTDIRKFKKPGSKKIYYECMHDIKKAMRKKVGEQRQIIKQLLSVLAQSEAKLKASGDERDVAVSAHVTKLKKDYEKVDKLLGLLISMHLIRDKDEKEK